MTNCYLCGAPFRWTGAGVKGRPQTFYRAHYDGPKGRRCADRNACANRVRDNERTLF